MNPEYKKYSKVVIDGVGVIVEAGLTIAQAFPVAKDVASIIDRILGLIHKTKSNKAVCDFIGERLKYAKSILDADSDNTSLNTKDFERYRKTLEAVEEHIKVITNGKENIKLWIKIKNFGNANKVYMLIVKKFCLHLLFLST